MAGWQKSRSASLRNVLTRPLILYLCWTAKTNLGGVTPGNWHNLSHQNLGIIETARRVETVMAVDGGPAPQNTMTTGNNVAGSGVGGRPANSSPVHTALLLGPECPVNTLTSPRSQSTSPPHLPPHQPTSLITVSISSSTHHNISHPVRWVWC